MNLEIIPLDQVPSREVVDLLRCTLGEATTRTEAYWRWKHRANPFGDSPGLVAVGPEGLAAVRVFLRWSLRTAAGAVSAVRAVDTATHPNWRRQGLFRRLTEELLRRVEDQGAELVFNTPNDASRPGYLSMGWRTAGPLPVVVKPRKPWRQLGGRLLGRANREGMPSGLERVDQVLTRPFVADLLEELRSSDRLATSRSLPYLLWRYAEVPGIRYGALARTEGSAAAVVVFRLRRRAGARELTIAELMATRCRQGAVLAARICRDAARRCDADYSAAIGAPGMTAWPLLRRARFFPKRLRGPVLTVRELGASAPNNLDPATGWDLSAGDMELF